MITYLSYEFILCTLQDNIFILQWCQNGGMGAETYHIQIITEDHLTYASACCVYWSWKTLLYFWLGNKVNWIPWCYAVFLIGDFAGRLGLNSEELSWTYVSNIVLSWLFSHQEITISGILQSVWFKHIVSTKIGRLRMLEDKGKHCLAFPSTVCLLDFRSQQLPKAARRVMGGLEQYLLLSEVVSGNNWLGLSAFT